MVTKVQSGSSGPLAGLEGPTTDPAPRRFAEQPAGAESSGARSADSPRSYAAELPGSSLLQARAAADVAWASQLGFWVHQRATYQVIGRYLSAEENKALAYSQFAADAPEFQGAHSTHRHAMRREGQSTEAAITAANAFVREQFARAWQAESRIDKLKEFGLALHALQDSTSPSHAGFQEWHNDPGPIEWGRHVAQEIINPGFGSELYRATQQAWDWFNQGVLPEGNLFVFGCDGCVT